MDFRFDGQVVLITGGASGIGREIALAFGWHGAHVALTYFSSDDGASETEAAIQAQGGQVLVLKADVTKDQDVEWMVSSTLDRFGRIDVLVTNAGGILQRSAVTDCSRDLWDRALAVNLTSTFLCSRAVLPSMEQAGKGCIITMSSLAARDGGGAGAAHYAAAKGGVMTFTRSLAKEVGPLGIRVNGIAPGLIATRFHDRFTKPEARAATVERTPLRRGGVPNDVAGVALFLASPYAAFIAGETIEVNGGQGMF